MPNEQDRRLALKDKFRRKVREEEIRWKQRSRCQWLNFGDKNTKFFHGVASSRSRINRTCSLVDGEVKLVNRDDIINHITDFFRSLYSRDEWDRPLLDNLNFACIREESAQWMDRVFKEGEIRKGFWSW